MDPIKPIEGTVSNAQEQAIALTEVMRERYWQQRAEKATNTVKEPDTAVEVSTRQQKQKQPEKPAEAASTLPNTYAEFSVDRDTHRVVVRIIDGDSGELIRTIPPEKLAKEIANGKLQQNRIRRRDIRL